MVEQLSGLDFCPFCVSIEGTWQRSPEFEIGILKISKVLEKIHQQARP
jgi:hypothetical protein